MGAADLLARIRAVGFTHDLAAAKSAGISLASLHRAASRLGVRRQKISMTAGWPWTLTREGDSKYWKGADHA